MIDPEVGDYVISPNKIYEITGKYKDGLILRYNVRQVDNPADALEFNNIEQIVDYIDTTAITLSKLRHLGEIVKKEEASKALEVLFKNS